LCCSTIPSGRPAAMLPAFLRNLKAAGYRIVHVIVPSAGKRSQIEHALSTKN
jgi:hypothetical protein